MREEGSTGTGCAVQGTGYGVRGAGCGVQGARCLVSNTQRLSTHTPVHPRTHTRRFVVVAFALLSALVAGCSSATDGGVPVGLPTGRLTGQVVLARDTSQSIMGAKVTLKGHDGVDYSGFTDASGSYTFPLVPLGPIPMVVTPPDGSTLASQTLQVTVGEDSTKAVLAALAPADQYAAATGLELQPSSINLAVGQTVNLTTSVLGPVVSGTHPSLVVNGGVGEVFPDGHFQATHAGAGTLVAAYGSLTTSIPVTVTASRMAP